jgi:hypothetical protein
MRISVSRSAPVSRAKRALNTWFTAASMSRTNVPTASACFLFCFVAGARALRLFDGMRPTAPTAEGSRTGRAGRAVVVRLGTAGLRPRADEMIRGRDRGA